MLAGAAGVVRGAPPPALPPRRLFAYRRHVGARRGGDLHELVGDCREDGGCVR